MNRDEVQKAFLDLIRPHVRIPDPSVITESSLLVDDLKVNSTRFVDIILEAEDRFKIEIGDDDMQRFERVGDAVDFICERTVAA
jgi:acyl carrier protein